MTGAATHGRGDMVGEGEGGGRLGKQLPATARCQAGSSCRKLGKKKNHSAPLPKLSLVIRFVAYIDEKNHRLASAQCSRIMYDFLFYINVAFSSCFELFPCCMDDFFFSRLK